MVGEALCTDTAFLPTFACAGTVETDGRTFARSILGQGAWLVTDTAFRLHHLHLSIALEVGERALRRVDRDLIEIRRSQPQKLSVQVGEKTTLQQRIIGKVDSRNKISRALGNLFRLGKEVVRPSVQYHSSDHFQRHQFFRNQFGWIQVIKRKFGRLFMRE